MFCILLSFFGFAFYRFILHALSTYSIGNYIYKGSFCLPKCPPNKDFSFFFLKILSP